MGASVGKGRGFVADINVTPFVDVMLVLLVIFMITAPLMTSGEDVELPQTKTAKALPTDKDHIMLTIRKNGTVYLDTYAVTDLDALEAQIRATATEQRKQVFLQADKDVPYGVVVAVIGHIRAAGIEKLGMVAEQPVTGTQPAQAPGTAGTAGASGAANGSGAGRATPGRP